MQCPWWGKSREDEPTYDLVMDEVFPDWETVDEERNRPMCGWNRNYRIREIPPTLEEEKKPCQPSGTERLGTRTLAS